MTDYYGTQGGQPPATTAISKSKLEGSVPAFPHPTTSLSNDDNNQLGGRASLVYPTKYLFSLIIFTILSSFYISKKRCITKQNKIKIYP
jgi:hypothetical protein